MLKTQDVTRLARARLRDAKILFDAKRYDGALYLCGYAVELALKARICKTLKWHGYPEKGGEFNNLQSLKVHDLDVLLRFTGREAIVKSRFLAEWSSVAEWSPEARYRPVGSATRDEARLMLGAAAILVKNL